jgi:bifunctional non-homologous end joining protein LigD
MSDRLKDYRAKRDFRRSPEPQGTSGMPGKHLSFVVQRHDATRLHYDFRLEWGGVLKSWAVAKEPSMDPADKRLAIETEDHPLAYAAFEGTIPKGQYGGGTVQIWDRGSWAPLDPATVDRDLEKGELKLVVAGARLRGGFVLVRMKPKKGEKRPAWLLIKERDSVARPASTAGPRPDFVPPQLCVLVPTPPRGEGWVHELKLDGYRIQLIVTPDHTAHLKTRTGLDWTTRFPAIAQAARDLPTAVIDGEAVALDENGQPDFATLQAALAGENKAPLAYYAFDLLREGGEDLRPLPLAERKARLRRLLPADSPMLRYLDHFAHPGEAVLASACRLAMEGVVSKRLDAPYASGRAGTWQKSKCRGRDEFVIGGWFAGATGLGALLVGARRAGRLVYLGRVGTGFSAATAARLLARLRPLVRPTTPFHGPGPARRGGLTWVEPRLVAEVAHAGWTEAGLLRQASFIALREDKPAAEVEPPAPARPARKPPPITNPDRILWPATDHHPALTKADLADYLTRHAGRILPHVAGRPLSILRAPDGIEGQRFFQRHAMPGQSPLIGSVAIAGQPKPFMRIDDQGGLLALAQLAAIELHPWGARAEAPDIPDRLVFDLDPAEDVAFARVVEAAHELRRRLEALGLAAFAKVTGGKGLHVTVPLATPPGAVGWPEAKQFARLVCAMMERDAPERFTTTMAKAKRVGRIFLDYLRNDWLATAVAPWSPRARPAAAVARPVDWRDVTPTLRPDGFPLTARHPPEPWPDLGAAAVPLRDAIMKATA